MNTITMNACPLSACGAGPAAPCISLTTGSSVPLTWTHAERNRA